MDKLHWRGLGGVKALAAHVMWENRLTVRRRAKKAEGCVLSLNQGPPTLGW